MRPRISDLFHARIRPGRRIWAAGLSGLGLLCLALVLSRCSQHTAGVQRDLLQEILQADRLEELEYLDLGTEPARTFLGVGWSVDEITPPQAALQQDPTFIWAVGETTEFVVPVALIRPLRLGIGLRPFQYPGAPPLGVKVSLNGVPLTETTLTEGDQTLELVLPADRLILGWNQLQLMPSRSPEAASVLPGSGELRRLTMSVFHVTIQDDGKPASGRPQPASDARPESPGSEASPSASQDVGATPTVIPGVTADGFLELTGPAQLDWMLRARPDSTLLEEVELVAGDSAEVSWQWIEGTEIEGLVRHHLSDSWFSSVRKTGQATLPASAGTLRLRVIPGADATSHPVVRIRKAALDFPPPTRPKHVLWVTLDTFRADHLGAYGNAGIHMPNLDRLARSGRLLSRLNSQIPITGPAHSSLFTGRYPVSHGVHNNGQPLAKQEETFADTLKAYGWETAAVVSLVVLHSSLQFSQGFDRYVDCTGAPWWRNAPEVTDLALDLMDRQWPERPFFLWAHYSDTHEPYTPPGTPGSPVDISLNGTHIVDYDLGSGHYLTRNLLLQPGMNEVKFRIQPPQDREFLGAVVRYLTMDSPLAQLQFGEGFSGPNPNGFYKMETDATLRIRFAGRKPTEVPMKLWAIEQFSIPASLDQYRGEAELVDREIGRLLEGLKANGMEKDTLIVVTNDHGEGLWNHAQPGHVEQLYEESVHSPGLLVLPGTLQPQVDSTLAQHVDLMPTLLEVLEIPIPAAVQGQSVMRPAKSPRVQFLQTFAPEASVDRRALVQPPWKLIIAPNGGRRELYQLDEDPAERSNLFDQNPQIVGPLKHELEAIEQKTASERPVVPMPALLDQEQMRALGYIR